MERRMAVDLRRCNRVRAPQVTVTGVMHLKGTVAAELFLFISFTAQL